MKLPSSSLPAGLPPLPVAITTGMSVVEAKAGLGGTVAGITQAFCIYRIEQSDALVVAPWSDIALANIVPARPLLPAAIAQNDRRNAGAAVMRELLALRQFGLTPAQSATLDELIAELCP